MKDDDDMELPPPRRAQTAKVEPLGGLASRKRQTTAPAASAHAAEQVPGFEEHEIGGLLPQDEEESLPTASQDVDMEEAQEMHPARFFANFMLCIVTLTVGFLMPTVVDVSRTATQWQPGKSKGDYPIEGERCLPYLTASVVMVEAFVNVLIGCVAIKTLPANHRTMSTMSVWNREKIDAKDLWQLLHFRHHKDFVWLTLTYCLGDVVGLCAIGRGGGLLFLSMSNSRLLFAAVASRLFLPRKKQSKGCECVKEWTFYFMISASLVAFAVGTTSGQEVELRRGTMIGGCLALVKALLSAVAGVFTEVRLKHDKYNIWQANTLLKMQSFLVALAVWAVQYMYMEEQCPEDVTKVAAPCIDKRGWDMWTGFVLIAEVGNGWLSVAILCRMSAIAKFVCKATTAPALYIVYWVTGFRHHHFEAKTFLPILTMTGCILAYAAPPCWRTKDEWAGGYKGT
mmetsp:Transcript_30800/g.71087  ORF Transcript_30800/g.71087 Transcript_30800/m.71087 type:complete len:455 (-) Transcript_30800:257-1621(-)